MVAPMLTINNVAIFSGDGAGDRSPRPGDGPARLAKGKAAGQAMTRATAMTSGALADLRPAGGPGLAGRERQGSRGRQVSRGQLSRQEVLRTPGRRGAARARMACRASAVARSIPVSPGRPSPARSSAGRRAPCREADTPDTGRRLMARARGTGTRVPPRTTRGPSVRPSPGQGRRMAVSPAGPCADSPPASRLPPGTPGRHGRDLAPGPLEARARDTSRSLTMPARQVTGRPDTSRRHPASSPGRRVRGRSRPAARTRLAKRRRGRGDRRRPLCTRSLPTRRHRIRRHRPATLTS